MQHPDRVVSRVDPFTSSLRVLMLGLAIGLVVMHHMVDPHQHGPDAAPAASSIASPMASGPFAGKVALERQHTAAHPPAFADPGDDGAVTAELHRHPDPRGDSDHGMAMLLHLCLAVLAAGLALAALAVVALWWRTRPLGHHSVARQSCPALPQPPQVSLRLAQLQILRL